MISISKLLEKLQAHSHHRLWFLIGGTLGFILLVALGVCSTYATLNTNQQTQLVNSHLQSNQKITLKQLQQMEARLISLNTQLKENAVSPEEIKAISAQVNDIQSVIHKLNDHDSSSQIQSIVEKENLKLFEKLTKVQKLVQQAKQQTVSHRYLSSMALPFQVLGIDIWNGQPMLTVAHKGESALMAKNDSRAGWTLIDLNFESSQVVFKNRQNQFVKLTV